MASSVLWVRELSKMITRKRHTLGTTHALLWKGTSR